MLMPDFQEAKCLVPPPPLGTPGGGGKKMLASP